MIDADDQGFYEKIGVPPPTFCPRCRKQRRLAWRNDMSLYSRKCDLCGKKIISVFSPDKQKVVYCQRCWWSDKWEPKSYAQEYNSDKPFFVQFAELQQKVPALALVNDDGIASVNCEYTQDFAFGKNCYMVFIAWKIEDSLYTMYVVKGKDLIDCLHISDNSERMYEAVYVKQCYNSKFAYDGVAVVDSAFCHGCHDVSNCFMCYGLRHKQHCFKNEQYTKAEYEKILAGYRLDTWNGQERARKEFEEFRLKFPRKFSNLYNSTNCTGDYIDHCKNVRDSFNIQKGEDCRYCEGDDKPKDSYDLSIGGELTQCYEGITPDHSNRSFFSIFSWKNNDVAYVDSCHSCANVFGCVGLKKSEYCILNKPYPKEEYEALRAKIIAEMNAKSYTDKQGIAYPFGEFFPAELSYFSYNESVAQDFSPLTQVEAEKRGYKWQAELQFTKGKETMKPEQIPDAIGDVPDSILNEILACTDCGRNYRIVQQELKFYRRQNIPIPRRCFYCRHKYRLTVKNPSLLVHRRCECAGEMSGKGGYKNTAKHVHGSAPCANEFKTSYLPTRPEIIYCEKCYLSEFA